jgi:hypothetical protein
VAPGAGAGPVGLGDHDPDLRPSGAMCRVCQKRPEIPDEKSGRCEVCVKAGRMAIRFRLAPGPGGVGLRVKAGEIAPRALRQKWLAPLQAYASQASAKPHLGLHEVEMIVARDHLETIRVAPDLAAQGPAAVQALRDAAERTDASW